MGQLLCLEKLAFEAQAHLDTGSGAWSLDGEIDVPATWRLLHDGDVPPEEPAVTLADLAGVFAPNAKVPDDLSRFGIAELAAHFGKAHSRYGYRAPTPAPGQDWGA